MVAMAISSGRKIYTYRKKYNLDIRSSFYHALQGISEFFSQNLEDIFGVVHQRIRDEYLKAQ